MSHHCHATDCERQVPPEMFMCKKHWFRLPREFRRKIWATYRVGQCDDKQPSREYCEAAKLCVNFLAEKEGKTPDVQLYDFFLR